FLAQTGLSTCRGRWYTRPAANVSGRCWCERRRWGVTRFSRRNGGLRWLLAAALVACSGLVSAPVPAVAAGRMAGSSYAEINAGQPANDAQQAALNALPESVQDNYAGYWNWMRLGPNPYANWTPPAPPWKFCYSSAFQGNDWRVEGLTVAQDVTNQLKGMGLIDGDLITA